tara:strand:- start:35 stop:253 length:219 start_codon:yes stop_codon:yes gene_type:complete
MQKTEKFINQLLENEKKVLIKVAHGALQEHLYEMLGNELCTNLFFQPCEHLQSDLIEKINQFLLKEGYSKGE